MSFHLVDRISAFEPRRSAAGFLQLPAGNGEFPVSLVVEAVGQLASFVAMESVDFAMRPVAAIAGEVLAHRPVPDGARLDLEIQVGALRPSAIRYAGLAQVAGQTVVELSRCTGAMLPMETFDDPERVRAHLERLRSSGIDPRTFPTPEEFRPRVCEERHPSPGVAEAVLEAPLEASFYADHFPSRPVYPATLLLDAKIGVAQRLVAGAETPADETPAIVAVRNVKVRAFTPPGGQVRVRAEAADDRQDDGTHVVALEAFADEGRVSTARVVLAPVAASSRTDR